MKKKDQISFDEQKAKRLQAEFDEEERLAREKDEANVALIEEWDDIQAKQEEKRNKPPTQAQQIKIMFTYLKNMEGKNPKDLKNKSFDSIQKMFDRAFKRVNTFVDFRTDLVEGSSKRAGDELEQEVTKKQKVDDVQETAEVVNDQEVAKIKELMEIVLDKEKKDLETSMEIGKAKHGSTRAEEGYERSVMGTTMQNLFVGSEEISSYTDTITDRLNKKFHWYGY
ncbi:hypothetical protein Tco_1437614 [Tanacetum coccineum]